MTTSIPSPEALEANPSSVTAVPMVRKFEYDKKHFLFNEIFLRFGMFDFGAFHIKFEKIFW
jgi:hypothetical protein